MGTWLKKKFLNALTSVEPSALQEAMLYPLRCFMLDSEEFLWRQVLVHVLGMEEFLQHMILYRPLYKDLHSAFFERHLDRADSENMG